MKRLLIALSLLVSFTVTVWSVTTAHAGAPVYHDCVVIVLDASGSMGELMRGTQLTRMEAAKKAIKAVVADVEQETHVGLLVFSGRNKSGEWLHPLGARNDTKMFTALDQLNPDGGTPLGSYIKKGANALLDDREAQHGYGSYRLLVVTDGEANAGREQILVEEATPEILARGITLNTIGVDMESYHTLATLSHSYANADNPKTLTKAIRQVFAEVSDKEGDAASNAAFAALEPIPDEMAMAMVEALSFSGNHPIGEAPPPPPPPPGSEPPATSTSAPAPPPPSSAACNATGGTDGVSGGLALLAGLLLLGAIRRQRS